MPVTMMSPSYDKRPWQPGFLVRPLGWLNEALTKILTHDRELFVALFELDAYRMHVLGLGVAHLDPAQLSSTIIENLARRSPQTSLRQILGSWPQGLDRILHALPDTSILAPLNYRALVTVLRDRATAAHLYHCQNITEPLIVALAALPPQLRRPPIFKLFDEIDGMDRFVPGLQFLCDRVDISFNDFVQELGSFKQTEQVRARIAALTDRLPLPDRLPDSNIGTFDRVDDPTLIRSLAKSWHNCLCEYLHEINEGTSLIYRSSEDMRPAAALLARVNRLGWALVDIKGPKNVDIDPKTASRYQDTFACADIPQLADIAAIRGLLWRRHLSRRR